ncbi:Uncharacterised protein [Anaerobiospirillum thomasii]|uniref:hypothetical protein n=1 Tax=Anaerobiospirillum thomasii TaxID=179995 RepID=UPI000D8A2CF7|nr:hypothetical protein [Anaerobiospirillum thomasii]SPT68148.1 Uncharacterised protein [Anaerobiospirillum thomasii]
MDYSRLFSGPKDGNFVAFIEQMQQNSIEAIKRHSETALLEKSEQLSKSNKKDHAANAAQKDVRSYQNTGSNYKQSRSQNSSGSNTLSAKSYRRSGSDSTKRASAGTSVNGKDNIKSNSKIQPIAKDPASFILSIIFTALFAAAIILEDPFFIVFIIIIGMGLMKALRRKKASSA